MIENYCVNGYICSTRDGNFAETNNISAPVPRSIEKIVEVAEEYSKTDIEPRWLDPLEL